MKNAFAFALLIVSFGGLVACKPYTDVDGPGRFDGRISGPAISEQPSTAQLTASAHDLDANDDVVNTDTFDAGAGFALDLPAGRYRIELTDDHDHVVATYPDVVVNGDLALPAANTAR